MARRTRRIERMRQAALECPVAEPQTPSWARASGGTPVAPAALQRLRSRESMTRPSEETIGGRFGGGFSRAARRKSAS